MLKQAFCIMLIFCLLLVSVPVVGAENIVVEPRITVGMNHSMALKNDGTVWTWGDNLAGQLGNEDIALRSLTPVQVEGISGVTEIKSGWMHNLALKEDGTVWAWGSNGNGQLGDGTTENRRMPTQVQGISDVVAIGAGANHSLAVRSDGSVWAWGSNNNYQLGNGSRIDSATPLHVQGVGNAIEVVGAVMHSMVLEANGAIWSWGGNFQGQLGDGSREERTTPVRVHGINDAIAIAAGGMHSMAIRENGTVWAWGLNNGGQLGDGTMENREVPVPVQDYGGVTRIVVGNMHSMALKHDSEIWAWGNNAQGQLGDGTTESRNVPVRVQDIEDVIAIAARNMHNIVLKNDGAVYAWGANIDGQLGIGVDPSEVSFKNYVERVLGENGEGFLNVFVIPLPAPPMLPPMEIPPAPQPSLPPVEVAPTPPECPPFVDVEYGAWYFEAVCFVAKNDIMIGITDTSFTPQEEFTRAQLAVTLWRMEGEPATAFRPIFSDIAAEQWYSEAVVWAFENDVVKGVSEENFAPKEVITREQFAAMLHRHAVVQGYELMTLGGYELDQFSDADSVSDWADVYMRWAVDTGLMIGTTPMTISPQGSAARAQAATILMRFIEGVRS